MCYIISTTNLLSVNNFYIFIIKTLTRKYLNYYVLVIKIIIWKKKMWCLEHQMNALTISKKCVCRFHVGCIFHTAENLPIIVFLRKEREWPIRGGCIMEELYGMFAESRTICRKYCLHSKAPVLQMADIIPSIYILLLVAIIAIVR